MEKNFKKKHWTELEEGEEDDGGMVTIGGMQSGVSFGGKGKKKDGPSGPANMDEMFGEVDQNKQSE